MKQEHKINISKIKWLLPLLVFILSAGILSVIYHTVQETEQEQIRTKAELNAVTYADRMVEELKSGISITKSLEQILISENGEIGKFDTIAESMMSDYVQSIQLAPGGVVTDIYPEAGNDAGKIDLIHDEKRGEIVNYGIENRMVIMQGPFDLNQGGSGIAIRNPVYLQAEDGTEYFWGLTIVIIRAPDIFANSVKALSDFGYEYCLSKTDSPMTTEYKIVDQSGAELVDPVSRQFELGGCTWKIEVMPENGWSRPKELHLIVESGAVMILLLVGLSAALLILEEQGRKFKKLSHTDGLTGLLNRAGFNEQMDDYLSGHGKKQCVGILLDIDNFKFINDVYGHATGDRVLRQLAASMEQTFAKNAITGRNGGDEFCILIKDCTADEVKTQIETFCRMPRSFKYKGKEKSYSISLGYAQYPLHAQKGSELFRHADQALYEVKLRGKNGCLLYKSDFHTSKRTQLGFALNDVSVNLPGAFFIYKADRKDERILYANREMIQFAGCKDLDEFLQFTGSQFRNLVHPDELDAVENSIWNQISSKENGNNDYVKYRLATKKGTYRTVLDYGRIVEDEHYGKVFYVLVIDWDFIHTYYDEKG